MTLSSSSADENSDPKLKESVSPTQLSTPIAKTKEFSKPISAGGRPKELPIGFVVPSKFGKATDANLKEGNITDVDRAKLIKTVATCVWVYTDTLSPACC